MLITSNWRLNTLKQRFPQVRIFPLAVMHRAQYQLLGKIATQFPYFYLLVTPLKWTFRFLYIPPTPFYYKPPPYPPNPLLINDNFSWKSKLKYAGVGITCFLRCKIFANKTWKSIYWKRLIEPVKHISWSFVQKS